MARPGRFELPTNGLEIRCSVQLSYGRARAPVRFCGQAGSRKHAPTPIHHKTKPSSSSSIPRPPPRGKTGERQPKSTGKIYFRCERRARDKPAPWISGGRGASPARTKALRHGEGPTGRNQPFSANSTRRTALIVFAVNCSPDARVTGSRRAAELRASDRSRSLEISRLFWLSDRLPPVSPLPCLPLHECVWRTSHARQI